MVVLLLHGVRVLHALQALQMQLLKDAVECVEAVLVMRRRDGRLRRNAARRGLQLHAASQLLLLLLHG
jgi:hypothetical protein